MRKVIIAGNWKMHKNITESIDLANLIQRSVYDIEAVEILVCPPFTSLSDVREVIASTNVKLGAQDVYWEGEGAFTGEVSCGMLKSVGCEYVIVGHSERRQYFGETNHTVNLKAKAILKSGMRPIVCVGEKLNEREDGKEFTVVKDQLQNSLAGISGLDMGNIVIAYEPVWAIGTGVNATKEQAQEMHRFIRGVLAEMHDPELAAAVRIQYGGSVKPDNIEELIAEPDVDGALVGGASLKADSFAAIVKGSLKYASKK